LLSKVDGVIIVSRVGRNRRDVAQRLHETLTGAGAPLLGVVANGFKSGRLGGYGYGYSYDYAASGGKTKEPPKTEPPFADGAASTTRKGPMPRISSSIVTEVAWWPLASANQPSSPHSEVM
jgi:Mrp family chromosome partitioning ATPase